MGKQKPDLRRKLRAAKKDAPDLGALDPRATPLVRDKAAARDLLADNHVRLQEQQAMLFAQGKRAVLVVIQAMDTGGKDGLIRGVFGPLNPQGVRVTGFKRPTEEELAHDFLWRVHRACPRKGMIGVFNRSHYEDVLVARVHRLVEPEVVKQRYRQINAFERHLSENGTTILKFMLHISKEEQRERLQARLDEPDKNWKFNKGDLAERKRWQDYMAAFQDAIHACHSRWAPWYIIPADRKWYRNYAVSEIVRRTLDDMDLAFPPAEAGLEGLVVK
jgi:PPK2 family polyphosphate:nucleotide phosphotransferase